MKIISRSVIFLLFAVMSRKKRVKEQSVPENTASLLSANTWRITAVKNNVNPANAAAAVWEVMNYNRKDTILNLYCVLDTLRKRSYISLSPCSYRTGSGVKIDVPAAYCETSVYYRDTNWSQLTHNDLKFLRGNTFSWVEQYNRSKFINTYGRA